MSESKRGCLEWCESCHAARMFWWVSPQANGCRYACGDCGRLYYSGPRLVLVGMPPNPKEVQ